MPRWPARLSPGPSSVLHKETAARRRIAGGHLGNKESKVDIQATFLRAAWKALDNHILHDGPFPNDDAILAIAPELRAILDPIVNEPAYESDAQAGVWVRVDEALPNEGEWVVVGSYKKPDVLDRMEFKRGVFWSVWSASPSPHVDVWMRLPPIPEKPTTP